MPSALVIKRSSPRTCQVYMDTGIYCGSINVSEQAIVSTNMNKVLVTEGEATSVYVASAEGGLGFSHMC